MDGAIGRVRSALTVGGRSPRRVESRGKDEDPRDFEQEFERQAEGGARPSSEPEDGTPEASPRAQLHDPDLGSHVDVVA